MANSPKTASATADETMPKLEEIELSETHKDIEEALEKLNHQLETELHANGSAEHGGESFADALATTIGYRVMKARTDDVRQALDRANSAAQQLKILADYLKGKGRKIYNWESVEAHKQATLKPFTSQQEILFDQADRKRKLSSRWGWTFLALLICSIVFCFFVHSWVLSAWNYVWPWIPTIIAGIVAANYEGHNTDLIAEGNTFYREWKCVPLQYYPQPIPTLYLNLALEIKNLIPKAEFGVLQFCNTEMVGQLDAYQSRREEAERQEQWQRWWNSLSEEERIRLQDPILYIDIAATEPNKVYRYFLAAWLEPKFHPVEEELQVVAQA